MSCAENNALPNQKQINACRDLVDAAVVEIPPPALKEVASRIGCTVCALRYRFPDQCSKLIALLPERRLHLREQQRASLRLALAEEPAPSMQSVALRLGANKKYLRGLHPDLCGEIRKRHDELKTVLASRRRAAFQAEIHAAVIDLNRRGIVPSRKRTFTSITDPSMRSPKIVDRQIAATLLELKLASGALFPDGHGYNHGLLGREPSAGRAESEP